MKTKTKKPVARGKKIEAAEAAGSGKQDGPREQELETIQNEVTAQPQTVHLEEWVTVDCPFCAESIEVHVTSEQDGQTMYEDCGVCCRPVSLHIQVEEDELHVEAYRS